MKLVAISKSLLIVSVAACGQGGGFGETQKTSMRHKGSASASAVANPNSGDAVAAANRMTPSPDAVLKDEAALMLALVGDEPITSKAAFVLITFVDKNGVKQTVTVPFDSAKPTLVPNVPTGEFDMTVSFLDAAKAVLAQGTSHVTIAAGMQTTASVKPVAVGSLAISTDTGPKVPEGALTAVEIQVSQGDPKNAWVGGTLLLQAVGLYTKDGVPTGRSTIPGAVVWSVSDGTVVSVVDSPAVIRGIAAKVLKAGVAEIKVTYGAMTATSSIIAKDSYPTSIAFDLGGATKFSILLDGALTPKVVATLSDGTTSDLSASATWSTDDAAIAKKGLSSSSGVTAAVAMRSFQAVAEGTTTIHAKIGTLDAVATVEVLPNPNKLYSVATPPPGTLDSLALSTPDAAKFSLRAGQQVSYQLFGIFKRNGVATGKIDFSSQASWTTDNAAALIVTPKGYHTIVEALRTGTGKVIAAFNGMSTDATLTVNDIALTSLKVSAGPSLCAIAIGGGTIGYEFLTVTGTFANGSTADITGAVAVTSSNVNVAKVDTLPYSGDTSVEVEAVTTGAAVFTATLGNVSGSVAWDAVRKTTGSCP